jgi:serine/threonine protein kinase
MPIGEGGMGTVYRAQDTKLNRPVAIKFLSDDLADAGARRRFQQEARMASALNHPHILTVHDAGEFGGRQYIVTEFVDGGTLKDWAKAEKRSWRQIVELLTGVADGLAAAKPASASRYRRQTSWWPGTVTPSWWISDWRSWGPTQMSIRRAH